MHEQGSHRSCRWDEGDGVGVKQAEHPNCNGLGVTIFIHLGFTSSGEKSVTFASRFHYEIQLLTFTHASLQALAGWPIELPDDVPQLCHA